MGVCVGGGVCVWGGCVSGCGCMWGCEVCVYVWVCVWVVGLRILFPKCFPLFYSLIPIHQCYYSHKINNYSHPSSHYSQ